MQPDHGPLANHDPEEVASHSKFCNPYLGSAHGNPLHFLATLAVPGLGTLEDHREPAGAKPHLESQSSVVL